VRRTDLPAVLAGITAVVVGFSGPTALIFAAASAGGLSDAVVASWLWAVAMGSGVAGLYLSWRYRVPVITAWSTPGVALLAAALPTTSWEVAVGAFIVANALILVLGLSGAFGRVMAHVPPSIAAALLGGILFPFAAGTLPALAQAPLVVGAMVIAFFAVRRISPLWAVPAVFASGLLAAATTGALRAASITLAPALPVFTMPEFSLAAVLGLAFPLALVGLTGQFLSGFAVLRANGFSPPENFSTTLMGGLSVLLAPFGCHGVNPSAIIAAICVGPEAHPDPARRFVAGIAAGVTYLVFGTFAAAVAGVFAALPPALVAALAGLGMLPAMASALAAALTDAEGRDAAAVTFVVTAAGVAFLGLGAAFWGLAAGFAVRALRRPA
jgi:benzoate membrane transport protein